MRRESVCAELSPTVTQNWANQYAVNLAGARIAVNRAKKQK